MQYVGTVCFIDSIRKNNCGRIMKQDLQILPVFLQLYRSHLWSWKLESGKSHYNNRRCQDLRFFWEAVHIALINYKLEINVYSVIVYNILDFFYQYLHLHYTGWTSTKLKLMLFWDRSVFMFLGSSPKIYRNFWKVFVIILNLQSKSLLKSSKYKPLWLFIIIYSIKF